MLMNGGKGLIKRNVFIRSLIGYGKLVKKNVCIVSKYYRQKLWFSIVHAVKSFHQKSRDNV